VCVGGGGWSTAIGATGMSVLPRYSCCALTDSGKGAGGLEGAGAGAWCQCGAEVLTNLSRTEPQELTTSSKKVNMTLLRRERG